MKSIFTALAIAIAITCCPVNAAADADVVGTYNNQSESSFIFSLKLDKNKKATYREPDLEGGKPFVLVGTWQLTENEIEINFGKAGKYLYDVKDFLAWDSFGCKGGSFGLQIRSTPKGLSENPSFHVWRTKDLKAASKCQH